MAEKRRPKRRNPNAERLTCVCEVACCPKCGGPVKMPYPAKFSMDDPYRRYRLRMRRMAKPKSTRDQHPLFET